MKENKINLSQIDSKIELKNINKNELQIDSFILQLSQFLNFNSKHHIFRTDNAFDKRFFISICFLRILVNSKYKIEQDIHFKIIKLFDETLYDIYKQCKIDKKTQNHEKVKNLQEYILKIDSKIQSQIPQIKNLDQINSFETAYKRILYSKYNWAVLELFFPTELKTLIGELLESIKSYQLENTSQKSKKYEFTLSAIDKIINPKKGVFTKYYDIFVIKPFTNLKRIIEDDFSNSTFGKPAKLTLKAQDKKYPLSNIQVPFSISFELVKEGDGIINNVFITAFNFSSNLIIKDKTIKLSEISQKRQIITFQGQISSICSDIFLNIEVSYKDYLGKIRNFKTKYLLSSQRTDIPWESLKYSDPYSSEPIDIEEELIGRKEILTNLLARVKGNRVASFFIHGQKRVGKTSIAKSFFNKLNKDFGSSFTTLYIETGEYQAMSSDIENTINALGEKICIQIKQHDPKLSNIPTPNFNGSFSSINTFFDAINIIDPEKKYIIALDEFDEINPKLYLRGELGDSFFLTLRAISNKAKIGLILVGGEKMGIIMSSQGEQINKFIPIRVDYFDKEKYYNDFKQLVTTPIPDIDIAENAIEELYHHTAGNPFFTKIICENLFNQIIERKDSFVSKQDMIEAINTTIDSVETNTFAHFWDDGIKEKAEKEEEISILRRKVLLAIRICLEKETSCNLEHILDITINMNLLKENVKRTITEFCERNILIERNGRYDFKVILFKKWLINHGRSKIITTFSDKDRINEYNKNEEEAKVQSEEIIKLTSKWETYKGKHVSPDNIRNWLEQFDDNSKQRLMFNLLENIRFYTTYNIRIKLNELYRRVNRKIINQEINIPSNVSGKKLKNIKRNDIVISYFDGIGKSGAQYAKLFADENKIYSANIVEKNRITNRITKDTKALVFVDDFVGTGNNVYQNIKEISENESAVFNKKIQIFVCIISGFQNSKNILESKFSKLNLDIEILFSDLLEDEDRVFSKASSVFSNSSDRNLAKSICYEKSIILEPKQPYGYGGCQALVVFPDTCPNNSLPILWKKSKNWTPLFERN